MTDLTQTIAAKSDILNADDLLGGAITVQVTKVSLAAGEQPIAINYVGDNNKPFMPCKTVRRVLVNIWGTDGSKYVGRSMTLYRDPEVVYAGQKVGGIRISHMSNIDAPVTMSLTATKKSKKPVTIQPLKTPVGVDPAVISAGDLAASQGVDVYTTWLATLTPDVKSTIKHLHAGWSAKAKSVITESVVTEEVI